MPIPAFFKHRNIIIRIAESGDIRALDAIRIGKGCNPVSLVCQRIQNSR